MEMEKSEIIERGEADSYKLKLGSPYKYLSQVQGLSKGRRF